MNKKHRKPAWWILYVLLVIMIGGLLLESRDGLPNWAHQVAEITIVLLFFGSVGFWLHINGPALWEEEIYKTSQESYHVEEYKSPTPWPPEEDTKDDNESSFSFQPYRSNWRR